MVNGNTKDCLITMKQEDAMNLQKFEQITILMTALIIVLSQIEV